jgi:2,3-bisphosphoglycerate-independent phosphoglycerate mutase
MSAHDHRRRPVVLAVLDDRASLSAKLREDAILELSAGRAATSDRSRLDAAMGEGRFADNEVLVRMLGQAKDFGGRLHLIGLLSDSSVHASLQHLSTIIGIAKKARVRVVVHALLDGRDVPGRTGQRHVAELEAQLAGGVGRIGTVSGRFWGMDTGQAWSRVEKCYRAITSADGYRADTARAGIEQSYEAGHGDETVEPFVVFDYPGVSPVDVAMHFNLTPEGARPLSLALASARFERFARKGGRAPFSGRYACLTPIDDTLAGCVVWPREPHASLLPELVARAGYRQLRCADAASYDLVTRSFNGGREEPLEGETREQVPSTGGAAEVARAAAAAIRKGQSDFIVVGCAPSRGVLDTDAPAATVAAIDPGLDEVVDAVRAAGGALIVVDTSRHGPIDFDETHSATRLRVEGHLHDVAPTVLALLDLPRATEMAGRSLLRR